MDRMNRMRLDIHIFLVDIKPDTWFLKVTSSEDPFCDPVHLLEIVFSTTAESDNKILTTFFYAGRNNSDECQLQLTVIKK